MNCSTEQAHIREIKGLRPRHTYRGEQGTDFEAYRDTVRRIFAERLGWRAPLTDGLSIDEKWTRPAPGGTVTKCYFTCGPAVAAPAYVVVPEQGTGPYPVMICLQGHSTGMHRSLAVEAEDEATPLANPKPGQDLALQCLQRGFAAVCVEQRGFGERRDADVPHMEHGAYPNCVRGAIRALGLGRTLLGERINDVAGALELIRSHPSLDETRVGIMGNSTGGTVSLASAALYPEQIHYAMPSCCFYPYAFSFIRAMRCLCAYIPGILGEIEIEDVAGLVAPRPLVLLAGRQDGFSWPEVQSAFERLKPIYAAAGAPDRCALVDVDGGHRFFPEEGWPVLLDLSRSAGDNFRDIRNV